MSQSDAKKAALSIVSGKLRSIDLSERAGLLSLGTIENSTLSFKAFGKKYAVCEKTFVITCADGSIPGDEEKILILHYLLCEIPYKQKENLITFREFKGGQFYLGPFIARTAGPLVRHFGNDLAALEYSLKKYECLRMDTAGFLFRIHAIGNVNVYLSYRAGDDEFPPGADILFDEYAKWVYNAEDAARVAGRICFGLMKTD